MKMHVATSVAQFDDTLLAVVKPSVSLFNRIEALPSGSDLDTGLKAALADPLWLLARQWQFNEFCGEDAGTPISTSFAVNGVPVSTYLPGADLAQAPQLPLSADSPPLEALVEREPALARHPRFNAEAGLHLQRMLAHLGPESLANGVVAAFPLALEAPVDPTSDSPGLLWHVVLHRRALNAAKLAADLVGKRDASGSVIALPTGVAVPPGDEPAALERLTAWLKWLEELVLEGPSPNPNWQRDRMEYAFSLAAFGQGPPLALQAKEYTDGRLDWHTFVAGGAQLTPQTPPPESTIQTIADRHPTPVRYPGMPADRYWEFEDARVNFAAVEAGPTDLTRMMIAEFALAFGNDWFMVPIELRVGALYQISGFKIVDSFGVEASSAPSCNADGTPWRMYEMTAGAGAPGPLTDVLFLPPVVDRALEGSPLEQLLLVRDEMANLAWGIEKRVQGASGEPIDRNLEAARLAMRQQLTLEADDPQLIYRLATHVPAHWIPLLPVRKARPATSVTEIWLQRAGLKRFYALPSPLEPQTGDTAAIKAYKEFLLRLQASDAFVQQTSDAEGIGVYLFHPRGKLLLENENVPVGETDTLILREEEVPRAGAIVKRAFQYARTPNGGAYLWLGRAKLSGRGEASSGLKFDTAAMWQAVQG
jgi:hypothetical protein